MTLPGILTCTTRVLLVEDSPADLELTRELLEESAMACELHVARDGEAALDFLHRRGAHSRAPRPDLVLLDLNLPRRSGWEVLRECKADPGLRAIPVVVLTTSRAEEDVAGAYDLQANCFVSKPLDLDGYAATMRAIELFWLTTARLPRPGLTWPTTATG